MVDFKEQFSKLIEVTRDPTAPIKVQDAYNAVTAVGKMMTPFTDEAAVNATMGYLCGNWSDEQLNELSARPEFVMALCGMLAQSLKSWKDEVTGNVP